VRLDDAAGEAVVEEEVALAVGERRGLRFCGVQAGGEVGEFVA
jgi:hypothetical protein